jgi:FKBP-type peptidyl-prolyl cis-trans isomerase
MLSKYEFIGIGLSVVSMALALYLVRLETSFLGMTEPGSQVAQVSNKAVVVGEGENTDEERAKALLKAADINGNINKLVIDDIVLGSGEEVKNGDTVSVHYVGKLQNGQEFDNSHKRGETLTFKVGSGRVIKGWEEGLLGMKVGGQRILVIPPEMAYGDREVGPIPANSTLIFAIELVEIR